MKTQIIFLLLLFASVTCCTNPGKPLSENEKDKIKSEVKEVVKSMFNAAQEGNLQKAMECWLDSPDFTINMNGSSMSHNEFMDAMKPLFNSLANQKATFVTEKYSVLDKTTVIYSSNSKWVMNLKDGSSIQQEPWAMLYIFKKIDGKWKLASGAEAGVEKNVVNNENSKGLNQAELLNKFVGNWEIALGNDTYEYVVIKSLQGGNGLSVYAKWLTKGKMSFEGTGFWGNDAAINKIDISIMLSTGDIIHDHGIFTSTNMMEFVNINNAPAMKGVSKSILEFISPDEIKETTIKDGKEEIVTWKRKK